MSTTNTSGATEKLDWSRLLGFDQTGLRADGAVTVRDSGLTRLGAKPGVKGAQPK